MKTAMTIVLMSAIVVASGCQSTSPRGGSMAQEEGFKIVVPNYDTQIKQGEVQTIAVSLQRGEYFKRDVKLVITAPEDISVEPTKIAVKGSDKPDVQLRITADKKAALGEYRVSVKGTPETGESTSVAFTVTVVAQ